jgi:hypothetical protein
MRRIALVCLLCLLVAACGEDGPGTTPSPPAPGSTPAPTPAPAANRAPAITSATLTPGFGIAFFTTFQLSGRATDADGDALTYSWSILNSSNAVVTTLAAGSDVPFNHQSLLRSAVARLTVSDGRGGTTTADTQRFNVGSMTGTWIMTSTRFPGATMMIYTLQQAQSGAVTGQARSTPGGPVIGVTDPAGGARIDAAGALHNLRIKFTSATNAVDFTVAGQMQPTVDINGTISNTTATFAGVPINGLAVTLSPQ